MRSEELGMRNEQSCPQAPSEARDKAHAQARRQRACGVQGQSPQRSLRQSLIRRQPTRCRYNEKKHTKVVFLIKSNNGAKICTAYPQLQRKSAKSKAILRRDEVGVELQGTAPSTSRFGERQGLNLSQCCVDVPCEEYCVAPLKM